MTHNLQKILVPGIVLVDIADTVLVESAEICDLTMMIPYWERHGESV